MKILQRREVGQGLPVAGQAMSESRLDQPVFKDLLRQPGYRLAHDLAVDFCDPSSWNEDEMYGREASVSQSVDIAAISSGSGQELGPRLDVDRRLDPLDPDDLLAQHMHEFGYQDTARGKDDAIAELIKFHAPLGRRSLVWSLYEKLSKGSHYEDSLRRYCHGTTIAVYMQSLVRVHFVGPNSARHWMSRASDRDNYPLWHGHFNQVVGEIAATVQRHANNPTDAVSVNSVLSEMRIGDPVGRITGDRDYYLPPSRDALARVAIANVPWHLRHDEAVAAINKGSRIKY